MKYLIGILSILVILALAFAISNNKKAIRIRPILVMIVVQFILGAFLLKTDVGQFAINAITSGFNKLLGYANEGVTFVFGGLVNNGEFSFFIGVLLPIVFISALIGILQHLRILNFIITILGFLLSKVNGMGRLESYNAVAALILGQQEVFISIKKQLAILPEKRLYTLCTSAMSTVSMAIVGAYMTILKPEYVVIAIVLNLFGGFIIASLINPYQVTLEEDNLEIQQEEKQSFFQVLSEYIIDGFKVAVIVGAMLIGFIALISMINAIFEALFSVTFQQVLGYVFSPIAYLIGIPMEEAVNAAKVMGTKLVANEFAAMQDFKASITLFSSRSEAIISVFLVSFANFSSIGIISGAVKALNDKQGNIVAKFGLKLLYGASLVSLLSATVVGLLFGI